MQAEKKRSFHREKRNMIDNTLYLKRAKENTCPCIERGFHEKIRAESWEIRAVFTRLRKNLRRKTTAIPIIKEL